MAEDVDPIFTETQGGETATHVRDYSRFVAMFKWGAIICFIIAMFVITVVL
jgi:hypothetical protein